MKTYDIILYGATGFTGGLVAEYFAQNVDTKDIRWALAGRSLSKLQSVKDKLMGLNPGCSAVGLIEADSSNKDSLKAMTSQGSVVLSTVGPFIFYGEPVVEACIASGTHFLDITGEPEYVKNLLAKYDKAAKEKGVLIVNCCGFDSIPADLGAYFTAKQFDGKEPVTVRGFVSSNGTFSGGTWASAINAFSKGTERINAMSEGSGEKKEKRIKESIYFNKSIKRWAIPMPVIDPWMVKRSAAARPEVYGNDFQYGQFIAMKDLPSVAGLLLGVGVLFAGAQIPFTKKMLLNYRKSGEGPTPEQRAKSHFKVTFTAESKTKHIMTRVSGGDPGYTETSKMLSVSALTLFKNYDKLPIKSGVSTPAAALGEFLLPALMEKGIKFEVL